MGNVRVHLTRMGIERVELVPEACGLPAEAFRLVGTLGPALVALSDAIRSHSLAAAGADRDPPERSRGAPNGGARR